MSDEEEYINLDDLALSERGLVYICMYLQKQAEAHFNKPLSSITKDEFVEW